jgi:hypothetical protein
MSLFTSSCRFPQNEQVGTSLRVRGGDIDSSGPNAKFDQEYSTIPGTLSTVYFRDSDHSQLNSARNRAVRQISLRGST